MAKWYMSAKKADFEQMAALYKIDPVIARIIRNRDLTEDREIRRYLCGKQSDLYPYTWLKDVQKAVGILQEKIATRKKIRVIGDYDVDGICSAYILWKGLKICGAKVDTVIPHRIKDGYGINEHLIEAAVQDGIDTIITCDNGIAAGEEMAYAKKKGMTCIVTDHHEIPYEEIEGKRKYLLPQADAVIDPKQESCTYPYPGICGAVVVYKLIEGMFSAMQIEDDRKAEFIELAGFATVCDVMELRDENRIIVKLALESMKHSTNQGIRALIQVNKLEPDKLSSYHLGFVLGPCMNATGRLDTAEIALELLQSDSYDKAIQRATHLKELNESRKEMTEQGILNAMEKIENEKLNQDKIMVVFLPGLHESLAGIVAGRIREKYGKPVFVLTSGEEGIKGSARSIPAYHIYDEMTKCSELFIKYGGHAMAAGLSMEEENIAVFRERINQLCTLQPEDFVEKILIDVPMPLSYVTESLVEQLSILEPFGNGNAKPVFAQKNVILQKGRKMGNGNMARFFVSDECGSKYTMLLFRDLDRFMEYVESRYGKILLEQLFSTGIHPDIEEQIRLDIIYYPSINEYRGRKSLQFTIQDYQ